PGSTARQMFEHRLLSSSEVFSTFILANSLAGFIVGPLVLALAVGLGNLLRSRDGEDFGPSPRPIAALLLASLPCLILLVCLLLTKSRSAWAGLFVGLLAVAWSFRRRFRARTLALAGAGMVALLSALGAAFYASGWL